MENFATTMPVSKVFDNSHMMITLPIEETAMTPEMLEIKHRALDFGVCRNCEDYEALLTLDVFSNKDKYCTMTVDVYLEDDEPPETTMEKVKLTPELADYYYTMAIRQLMENIKAFGV